MVFQLYKTTACFATCWLALAWVDFRFTWWGVVGAAIWVVNGTLAIVAVQKAGLGIAQSIWSGLSSTHFPCRESLLPWQRSPLFTAVHVG